MAAQSFLMKLTTAQTVKCGRIYLISYLNLNFDYKIFFKINLILKFY